MFVMADESVRWLNNRADATVALALAGPGLPEPSPDDVAKPAEPYRLMIRDYWRYLKIPRAQKGLMTFRLAPDRRYLQVDFRHYDDPKDANPERWRSHFQEFSKTAPIEHVEVIGHLRAPELQPFLEIPTLRRLTVTGAEIADDQDAVLAGARNDIVVD
jgi:hypothetical protein